MRESGTLHLSCPTFNRIRLVSAGEAGDLLISSSSGPECGRRVELYLTSGYCRW